MSFDRMLTRTGEDWTYQLWTKDETLNAYRRSTHTLGDPVEVRVIRTETSRERTIQDALGQERLLDATILVKKTLISLLDAVQDESHRAPVLTDNHGTQFEAVALGREGERLGFARIFLVKMRSSNA